MLLRRLALVSTAVNGCLSDADDVQSPVLTYVFQVYNAFPSRMVFNRTLAPPRTMIVETRHLEQMKLRTTVRNEH